MAHTCSIGIEMRIVLFQNNSIVRDNVRSGARRKKKRNGEGGSNQIKHEFKSQHRNTHNHNNHTQQYRNIERAHIKMKVTDILSELPKPSLNY